MKPRLITTIVTAALIVAFVWMAQPVVRVSARQADKPAAPAPRMADGHPDLTGVWWGGADVGAARGRGGGGARGGGRGAQGARGTPPPTFMSLYKPEWAAKAKTLSDKDDPTLRCRPTAFGTLNVSMYDVGAVGQIIATPKMVVILTETYHGFRLIPTDGRPHPDDVPPAYRGDSIGHWDGDVFVVDTKNFTENTWMSAEGRVSPHSDQLHIVERYRRVDANTLEIEAKVEDPEALTAPWNAPKQTLVLAPFDRIMSLNCSGIETQALMDAAAKQQGSEK
ncbi:MAG TPA: hypothetical protein VH436_18530 [Vicinamibacterales bacterium]|jgi:hypothetical protein